MVRGFPQALGGAVACLVCVAVWLGSSGSAFADEPTLRWNPRWTRFTTAQYALAGTMAGGLLATDQFLQARDQPRWRSDILLDGQARRAARRRQRADRQARLQHQRLPGDGARALSVRDRHDVRRGGLHGSYDVAYQMALISVQAVLVTKLVTGLTKDLVGRARPDSGRCEAGNELACGTETESFISGHTSGAFAGAGLICAHHQNLPLYGDNAAGTVACGLALGTATTVGTLRLVADRHHLSDVLAGAAVGLAAGYLLPNLTNYDFGASSGDSGGVFMPLAGEDTVGVTYLRTW